MRRRVQEVAAVVVFAMAGTLIIMAVAKSCGDAPVALRLDTAAVEQRITDDRIAKAQADAGEAMALCGYARSEAALSNAKADWLRARLEILYRRQGSMPRRLSQWPGGDVAAMEAVR